MGRGRWSSGNLHDVVSVESRMLSSHKYARTEFSRHDEGKEKLENCSIGKVLRVGNWMRWSSRNLGNDVISSIESGSVIVAQICPNRVFPRCDLIKGEIERVSLGKERKGRKRRRWSSTMSSLNRVESRVLSSHVILSMVEGFNRLGRRCGERGIERPPLGSVPA